MANEYQLRLRDANAAERLRVTNEAAAADQAAAAGRYAALQQAKDQQETDHERQLAAQSTASQVLVCAASCLCTLGSSYMELALVQQPASLVHDSHVHNMRHDNLAHAPYSSSVSRQQRQ